MRRGQDEIARRPRLAAALAVGVLSAAAAVLVLADRRLVALGRADLRDPGSLIYVVAIVSATVVGSILVARQPTNPVGWCFAGLGASMTLSGALDSYALIGAVADPGSLPYADVAAVLGDASFIPWLVLVALALHLTPTGRWLTPRWGRVALATVLAASVWWVAKCLSGTPLDAPFTEVSNPFAVRQWAGAIEGVRGAAGLLTGFGLLVAGSSLLVRFRRARGTERRQLQWLALVVIPLPVFVGLSFVGASTGRPLLVIVSTSGFVALIPIAAGFAIGRYHLYDVDRLLGRATTYMLLTAGILVAYVAGVLVINEYLQGWAASDRATGSAAVAAVAVAVAAPARHRVQDLVDRSFGRRRYAALAVVRAHARQPDLAATDESVLRRALGDDTLAIAYWIGARGVWVTAEGRDPDGQGRAAEGRATVVVVTRHGHPVARISFAATRCEIDLVETVGAEALAVLENTGLRAALALELVEVQASRARIAQAQQLERQRIERDLHDGAQQRLLALAMRLQAALVNGDADRLRAAARSGVEEAQATVRELRELANGLHPVALASGGLAAAVDDLASRMPGLVEFAVPDRRYSEA
ncbi:MAG: histidine kinase dimerization/phosphoacceptor domain-containing protein, partial [Nocardioides sp.]|uniref:sensor histidine kinase n=1 Tax=Nocardioides sp. TaxID=35761 RepID=UPI00326650B5